MPEFNHDKNYLIQVYEGLDLICSVTLKGDTAESMIVLLQQVYPKFRRIAVYEDETKEAVGVIKRK